MKHLNSIKKFFIIILVAFIIPVLIKFSYDFTSTKYYFYQQDRKASFHRMKNTQICNSILEKYKPLEKLPIKESYRKIPDLIVKAVINRCWNKSPSCYADAIELSHTKRDLYKLFPLHAENNSDYHKWSYADKEAYKVKKQKADIALFDAQERFEKSCKRTLLSSFIDNFR